MLQSSKPVPVPHCRRFLSDCHATPAPVAPVPLSRRRWIYWRSFLLIAGHRAFTTFIRLNIFVRLPTVRPILVAPVFVRINFAAKPAQVRAEERKIRWKIPLCTTPTPTSSSLIRLRTFQNPACWGLDSSQKKSLCYRVITVRRLDFEWGCSRVSASCNRSHLRSRSCIGSRGLFSMCAGRFVYYRLATSRARSFGTRICERLFKALDEPRSRYFMNGTANV